MVVLSCAPKQKQTVLRNQIPSQIKYTLEVTTKWAKGFGAPLSGERLLTVYHLGDGAPTAYWMGSNGAVGPLELRKTFKQKDLAIYRMLGESAHSPVLSISDVPPEIGEEVYWAVHTLSGNVGLARGWVTAVEKDYLLLGGWAHPGTSGSPVLRADGTVVGIVSGGINWSCQTYWNDFKDLIVADQIECLFKKSFFPAAAGAARVDGLF